MIRQTTILVVFLFGCTAAARSQQVSLYPNPEYSTSSNEYKLRINKQEAEVHHQRVADFCNFSFEGKITVEVEWLEGKITTVDIRPKRSAVKATVKGQIISFTLSRPCQLSVEINGNIKHPLFVFANAMEKNKPDSSNAAVKYFAAGKVYHTGAIILKTGQQVYIEGGAIVKGNIFAENASGITISGRGILDGSVFEKGETRQIEINNSSNILIDGIIITDSRHWTAPVTKCRNVLYNNVKIISGNEWDDGIDVVSCKNVLIQNCFIRTKDDCIAIKAGVSYFYKENNQANTDSVTIDNCVLWNAEWGNGMEIGFETRTDSIKNIVFKNCDLIHVEGSEGTFTIHNGDRAVISNVLYENNYVEDSRGLLIDFKVLHSVYSKDSTRGKIENIVFKNITVTDTRKLPSLLLGHSAAYGISNVLLRHFMVNGKIILSDKQLGVQKQFATKINYAAN